MHDMNFMREVVTAILGISIVIFTLAMTALAFGMAGEARMRDAITVLTLLFGLAGVVVGYYFGRLPAEKRADTATDAMDLAMHDRTEIISQAAKVHDDMENRMDEAGLTSSMLRDKDHKLTDQESEHIKEILMQVQQDISVMMTRALP
jgi:hypothetical protein